MEALQNDWELAYLWLEAFLQTISSQMAGILQNLSKTVGCTLTAPIRDLQQPSCSHLAAKGMLSNDCSLAFSAYIWYELVRRSCPLACPNLYKKRSNCHSDCRKSAVEHKFKTVRLLHVTFAHYRYKAGARDACMYSQRWFAYTRTRAPYLIYFRLFRSLLLDLDLQNWAKWEVKLCVSRLQYTSVLSEHYIAVHSYNYDSKHHIKPRFDTLNCVLKIRLCNPKMHWSIWKANQVACSKLPLQACVTQVFSPNCANIFLSWLHCSFDILFTSK